MIRIAFATCKKKAFVPLPPTLLAEIVIVAFPTIVGTPLMTPVVALRVNPLVRLVAPYRVGLPLAVIW